MLAEKTVKDFVSEAASAAPVPGGGGVSALVGALGIALGNMVGELTTGKKKYADVEEDIQALMTEAGNIKETLLSLIEEDAQAFEPLAKAYGIPKDDPSRAEVLEAATRNACKAPYEMMVQIAKSIELLEEMGTKGSKMLVSDVGCGALFARAALEAASMNVFVNTKSYKATDWAPELEAKCDALLSEYIPRAEACAASVMARIRG